MRVNQQRQPAGQSRGIYVLSKARSSTAEDKTGDRRDVPHFLTLLIR